MCDCIWPIEVFGNHVASEWIGQDQRLAHPASPLGGGGAGMFRSAGVLNHDAHTELLPHSQSPAAPLLAPEDKAGAEQLQAAPPANPAPKVTAQSSTTVGRLEIVIEPDGSGGTSDQGAVTTPVLSHSGPMRSKKNNDKSIVLEFDNQKQFKVVIQTVYHRGTPEMHSKYGRGKTAADLATGDITLGFHESCHRADLLDYFTNVTQPQFTGQPNMPTTDFEKAFAEYLAAWKALEIPAQAASVAKTDEVDPKESNYKP